MAAPTDAGFELGVHDGEAARDVDKGAAHGLGLTAEDPIGFDDKNEEEEEETAPVAKKARVEKADNGLAGEEDEDEDEAAFGVESVEGLAEKDVDETELDPLLGHDNGAAESPVEGEGEGDDEEEVSDEVADEDDVDDDVTGKEAHPPGGAAGLRTLLHEGDATTKTGAVLNGTDATLNGAK